MRKLFIKQPYVSSFKNQNKFFIKPTGVAMVTRRRNIDRVHFAPFSLFLAISGHIFFLFLSTDSHDKQNDTLHTISLENSCTA